MSNVRPFRNPIFNGELRTKLEESASPFTDKPAETVTAMEQTLLSFAVIKAREIGHILGTKLANKVLGHVQNSTDQVER